MNALAAAKLAKARASKPKMGGGLSMPDIPIEGLLKLVGVVALCAAVYFVYTLLPSSGNLPATYARLVEIYKEHEQLPDEGAERDQFVTNAIEDSLERIDVGLESGRTGIELHGWRIARCTGCGG